MTGLAFPTRRLIWKSLSEFWKVYLQTEVEDWYFIGLQRGFNNFVEEKSQLRMKARRLITKWDICFPNGQGLVPSINKDDSLGVCTYSGWLTWLLPACSCMFIHIHEDPERLGQRIDWLCF